MRRQSRTFLQRAAATREFRRTLIAEVGRCEVCGHNPRSVQMGEIAWRLAVHEILRGPLRQSCLDKRHSVLVVCFLCHEKIGDKGTYPEARQLAFLRRSRPRDYNLAAHNRLANPRAPNRVTEEEVSQWLS